MRDSINGVKFEALWRNRKLADGPLGLQKGNCENVKSPSSAAQIGWPLAKSLREYKK